ncbi:hypothetical protein ACU8V7_11620 [Zobellia nedashkovskayae]
MVVLIVIGVGIGLFLNTIIDKRLKNEIIVKPNFESNDYLYSVIEEIQANIRAKDTLFFKNIGIDLKDISSFSISVQPIDNNELDIEKRKENNKYLETLQNYKDNDFVIDVVKSEILKKSVLTYRIIFSHKKHKKGEEIASQLMKYINSNPYFNELKEVYFKNAKTRIIKNQLLIDQIDGLVQSYSIKLSQDRLTNQNSTLVIEGEKGLDITGLLALKSRLIKEIEKKEIELSEQQEPIKIISFGKTQMIATQFFSNGVVIIPATFLFFFCLLGVFSYLNRKSKELL